MAGPSQIVPRIVKVSVGLPGAAGLLFQDEYITGKVKNVKGSKPNEATVTIHNLSTATVAQLEAPNQVIHIQAGEGFVGQLFYGDIVRRGVVTVNNAPDRTTTIKARDGRRVIRDTRVTTSYPNNTPVAAVVQDLIRLATLQGITLGLGSVFPADNFPNGWAHQGEWRVALTEILAPRGFYWEIQGRVIYVLSESSLPPGNVPLVSPATGLIGSPKRTAKGCDLVSTLNPAIMVSRGCQVTSQFFNGLYRAQQVEHAFSSDGLTWKTSAKLGLIK